MVYTYKFPLGQVIEDNSITDTSDPNEGKYKPATPFKIKTSDGKRD